MMKNAIQVSNEASSTTINEFMRLSKLFTFLNKLRGRPKPSLTFGQTLSFIPLSLLQASVENIDWDQDV